MAKVEEKASENTRRSRHNVPRKRTTVITPQIAESHGTKRIREANKKIIESIKNSRYYIGD